MWLGIESTAGTLTLLVPDVHMTNPCDLLECYLVGGAVRDALLDESASDRDWVVIGASPEEMTPMRSCRSAIHVTWYTPASC